MKASLQVRLSQHLALTPQLQQSIRLLQLSTLELHQEIEQMLEQNPFLETEEETPPVETTGLAEVPDAAAAPELQHAPGDIDPDSRSGPESADGATDAGDDTAGVDTADFGTTERDDWDNGTDRDDFEGIREMPGSGSGSSSEGDDDFERQGRAERNTSLEDHLRAQLSGLRLSDEDAAAVLVLIDSLNEDGYLADPLEEIAQRLAEDLGVVDPEDLEELADRLQCALRWLQSMEPTGVGARSLAECLCLQLNALPKALAQPTVLRTALGVCGEHLALLARRDFRRIAQLTGSDEATVRAAQALIVACEPKPGRPFTRAEDQIIIPDVVATRIARQWRAVLNPDVMPKLRVNDLYAQAIKSQRSSGSALGARLQEARWFIRNIQQRFDTILRVSQAIIERQKNFFNHGAIAMKPLVLREIADELGLHESTISRVTTAKYMATPFGTYELKYFFGSSLNTDAGGNASSTAVRALIKQLVAAESSAKPLSDSQLAELLEGQGIQVARRTVAKYREALKIAPANLRRAV
ncbi:MAG TPA: RNA polymerase factor sigma-54 [Burkholderiaceae bacterium]|nr:RNA polymerase factor sigma-54 [Burkholderiaceae bacterium]